MHRDCSSASTGTERSMAGLSSITSTQYADPGEFATLNPFELGCIQFVHGHVTAPTQTRASAADRSGPAAGQLLAHAPHPTAGLALVPQEHPGAGGPDRHFR